MGQYELFTYYHYLNGIKLGDEINPAISTTITEALTVPRQIENLNVIRLSNFSFKNCNFISISLPDTIEEIGDSCFENTQIQNFQGPASCGIFENLYYATFGWCPNLEEVILPNTVTHLDDKVFLRTSSLKVLRLPDHLSSASTGLYLSSLTDIHFCGSNLVTGTIDREIRIHVTSDYQYETFMGSPIFDRNANCLLADCKYLYPQLFICPTYITHYFTLTYSVCFAFILI